MKEGEKRASPEKTARTKLLSLWCGRILISSVQAALGRINEQIQDSAFKWCWRDRELIRSYETTDRETYTSCSKTRKRKRKKGACYNRPRFDTLLAQTPNLPGRHAPLLCSRHVNKDACHVVPMRYLPGSSNQLRNNHSRTVRTHRLLTCSVIIFFSCV
jgi:hypothetical protein